MRYSKVVFSIMTTSQEEWGVAGWFGLSCMPVTLPSSARLKRSSLNWSSG